MSTASIAAAYIRVSTDDQEEYSPDSQLRLIQAYAEKNGYHIPQAYIFQDDGISAATARKRPAFNRMISLAKEKEPPFGTILVLMFSRFCRNREESVLYKSLLRRNGVSVISVKEPSIDGPFGSLMESIIEWFDEYYLINLSSEVRRGMNEKFLRGEAMGVAPFGYRIDSAHKTFSMDEERAPIVRDIFVRYANGASCREISAYLTACGITTRRGNPPDQRFVAYLLQNPVYIGKLRWTPAHTGDTSLYPAPQITDGKHPAIVPTELWASVQQRMARQKSAYGTYQRPETPASWTLKGLIRCSSCGGTLTLSGTHNGNPTLQCHRYAKGTCSVSHALSLRRAESALVALLSSDIGHLPFTITIQASDAALRQHDKEYLLAAERRKLTRCRLAYQNGIDTLEEYQKNKAQLSQRIQYLEKQAPSVSPTLPCMQTTLLDFLQSNASADAKNKALRTIIDHIVFDKAQRRLVVYFYR